MSNSSRCEVRTKGPQGDKGQKCLALACRRPHARVVRWVRVFGRAAIPEVYRRVHSENGRAKIHTAKNREGTGNTIGGGTNSQMNTAGGVLRRSACPPLAYPREAPPPTTPLPWPPTSSAPALPRGCCDKNRHVRGLKLGRLAHTAGRPAAGGAAGATARSGGPSAGAIGCCWACRWYICWCCALMVSKLDASSGCRSTIWA
jgi:hypothetical protein